MSLSPLQASFFSISDVFLRTMVILLSTPFPSFSVLLPFCLSVCLSVCLYVGQFNFLYFPLSLYQFFFVSVSKFVNLLICLSVFAGQFVCLSFFLLFCPSVCLFALQLNMCLSVLQCVQKVFPCVWLPVSLYVRLLVYLSVCL